MHRVWLSAGLFVLTAIFASSLHAQSIAGLRIGDDIAKTAPLGAPEDTGTYKVYALRKWSLANGNDLSISSTSDGKIAYMETDWNFKPEAAAAGLFDFTFGKTTLTDIRAKLASNGMAFERRSPVTKSGDDVVMFNSYEVGSTIVTFVTLIRSDTFNKARANPDGYAMLVALSFASAAYAEADWGKRILDPAYKKLPAQ